MPRFLPITGYVVKNGAVKNVADIITPPFDDLHLALRQERSSKHPDNFVRFESFKELPGEKDAENLNRRAVSAFNQLIEKKILVLEKPCYYLMEIKSGDKILSGFLGMLELNASTKPSLFETPVSQYISDRIQQLESMHIQTAPVTIGYRIDDSGADQLDYIKTNIRKDKPLFAFEYPAGTFVSIWNVPVEKEIEPFLSRKSMVLLNGGARYLAAVEYSRKISGKDKNRNSFKSYNFIYAWMVDLERGSYEFKSRHWALQSGAVPKIDGQTLLVKLEDQFEIERYKLLAPGAKEAELVNLLDEMDFIGKLNHTYGLYVGDKAYYLMYLKNAESYERLYNIKKSRRWKRLDFSIMNTIIFEKTLGLSWDKEEDLNKFSMSISPQRAVSLVDEGFADAAFIINDPMPEHLIEISETKETIPSRCVYLNPKPLVGPIIVPISQDLSISDNIALNNNYTKIKK